MLKLNRDEPTSLSDDNSLQLTIAKAGPINGLIPRPCKWPALNDQ